MSLWTELKRRRVVRVAGVYAVVAWVLIQVAATVFPHLMLPAWSVRLVVALAMLGLPLVVVLTWMFDVTPEGIKRVESAGPRASGRGVLPVLGLALLALSGGVLAYSRTAPGQPDGTGAISSIAVLPFADMSPQGDQEYFSDGIAEELLDALAKVAGLQVASRTSAFTFKGSNASIREIGQALGVESVLEGSVRKDGERVRITAQLIDARTDRHLWSETYDREIGDIFAVQDEISRAIVSALRVRFAAVTPLVVQQTEDPAAYELYLRGRFFWNKHTPEGYGRAIESYEQALALDPGYALAYAGIADVWSDMAMMPRGQREAFPRARLAARRAIELDPTLAEAHAALGWVQLWYEWDVPAAGRSLAHAVALNPRFAVGLDAYANYLSVVGRLDESIALQRRARDLEPLTPWIAGGLGFRLMQAGRYEEALAEYERAVQLDPSVPHVQYGVAFTHLLRGAPAEAVSVIEGIAARDADASMFMSGLLALAYAEAGRPDEARRVLARFSPDQAERPAAVDIAYAHAALGDMDEAFRWIGTAIEERESGVVTLPADPRAEPLRGDPRFATVLSAIGPQAARSD